MSDRKQSIFKILLRVTPIQFKTAPALNILLHGMGILHGSSFALSVFATQVLFDAVTSAAKGLIGFSGCVMPLLILAGITFGQQIMNGTHNFFAGVFFNKSAGGIKTVLQMKLQRIDPARFEAADFLDDMNKAREGAAAVPYFSSVVPNLVFFYGSYFVAIGSYLFFLKPLLLITLVLSFIPAFLGQLVRAKVFTKLEEQNAPLRREYEYYQKTLCDREYFKETRILGAFKYFHKLFSETMSLLTRKTWQAERKTALLLLLLNISTFAGMVTASYILYTATMAGEITVGAFAAVFSSLGLIFYIMQEIFYNHINNMNKDIGKVANFVRMLDIPEQKGTEGTPDFSKGIVADSVTFAYPGRESHAVSDVSLTVADGETVAIVGENGAGKSTLVRLLTGIYQPTAGKVTAGGLDTAETAPFSVFKGISGVFQKYQRYKMTLAENVTISDTGTQIDKKKMENAINVSDLELGGEVTPETMLSPEFDGIDLSGGQWQRLAIARGLYRANGFIVLDEPTPTVVFSII